ncbi:MAG: AraC family transcriptional regulator, partial [Planctomycetota bacterium]|nr:AraC family transcriptional regulator [Planctomycetota bacterium]
CDGIFVRRLLRRSGLPCNRPFTVADPLTMERHLLAIYEEITRHTAPDGVIVRNLLENWLRETARHLRAPAAFSIPPGLLAVRHLMETEYEKPFNLAELAAQACMSIPHFCSSFKRYFGSPAIDYLIQQRLRRAAVLLQESDLKVQQVAQRVGYNDLYHFSKLFKKHYGVSPRRFARRVRHILKEEK